MSEFHPLIPCIAQREAYADQLVLLAVQEFTRQGVRVTVGQRSPDYLVKLMRQSLITQGCTTHELNQAVLRLRRAGKIVDAPLGKYECHHPRFGLVPTELRTESSTEGTGIP